MKAVVLAAGEGQRLRPLTFTRPKHMIPVGGKPILEHLIGTLREAEIEEILIVVNYKSEMIKEHFNSGERFNVKIDYVMQEKVLGTADAIAAAENYINNEDFLAVNGDLLLSVNAIKPVLEVHEKAKPMATLAAVQVENPEHYGVLKIELRAAHRCSGETALRGCIGKLD
jgi:NDP-sugar pyrophosphorylase family protein